MTRSGLWFERCRMKRLKHASMKSMTLIGLSICPFLLAQRPTDTMSADGFVTQAGIGNNLQVGTLVVQMSDKTHCSKYDVKFGKRNYNATVHKISVPCVAPNLSVGSYVHLRGVRKNDGSLAATEIEIDNPWKIVGGNHPHAVIPSPITDWRTNDFLSGGPLEGKLNGGAFLEEVPEAIQTNQGFVTRFWLNGFPLEATHRTIMHFVPHGLDSRSILIGTEELLGRGWHIPPKSVPIISPSPDKLLPNTYISYKAQREPNRHLVATRLALFPNTVQTSEKKYLNAIAPQITEPNYEAHIPGSIRYKYGSAIQILSNRTIQEYVRKVGTELVPAYQKSLASFDPSKINFRFFVVRPFDNFRKNQFVQIDGRSPEFIPISFSGILSPFVLPINHSLVDRIVEMPDGVVLIPDTELAMLRSKAQLVFSLSVAIQSIVQRQAYIAASVMGHANESHYKAHPTTTSIILSYTDYSKISAIVAPIEIGNLETQQTLRLGIRQMYLAGYDIREAPFAWAVAQGKPVNNPIINSKHPDKEIPWYAAYAFNYISHYYKDVDYSKLKRGEKEYQQFLQELYKADPSLPRPKVAAAAISAAATK